MTKGRIAIHESSPGVQRGFCQKCGTSLTYTGADWDDPAVLSATLDDPGVAKPTTNVYLEHQSFDLLTELDHRNFFSLLDCS